MPLPRTWLGPALLALTALAAPAAAQDTPMRAEAAVRPALWKMADEDTTIWLFGTIHILPEQVDWHQGPVAAALGSSRELVTEIPIDDTPETQGALLRRSVRTDGKHLRETLSERQRAAYEGAMASIGLPVDAFDANDAWFAALMLTLIPLQAAGYATETGIDQQVATIARARGMANHALETVEYQIGLFDDLPEATQRTYLADVVKALPDVKRDVGRMVAAWKTGDAEGLAALMNEDESDPAIMKVLITDRNVAWARWLKARMDEPGSVFVAVGAGHLAGPGSVQDQLARAGIATKRVQ